MKRLCKKNYKKKILLKRMNQKAVVYETKILIENLFAQLFFCVFKEKLSLKIIFGGRFKGLPDKRECAILANSLHPNYLHRKQYG